MKKAACDDAAGTNNSKQADAPIIASCQPSDYLRARPLSSRCKAERQWENHKTLAQLERYLKALSWYRHRLEGAL